MFKFACGFIRDMEFLYLGLTVIVAFMFVLLSLKKEKRNGKF